jgi:hypothetical protein
LIKTEKAAKELEKMKQERYNLRHQNNNAEISTTISELVVGEEAEILI